VSISQEFFDRARAAADDDHRLAPGPMSRWGVFPFEAESLRVVPLTELEEPEPLGDQSAEACRVCRFEDDPAKVLWRSKHFTVARKESTSLLFWATIAPQTHVTLDQLDADALADMGLVLGRVFTAVRGLDGVGRVHLTKWENTTGHLLWNVMARPEGVLQLRGSNLPVWADMLPPIPEDEFAGRAAEVAALLTQS
jgi:diadenosine tetraphosphate (Ap4A) HIT family hydrolase